MRLRDLNGFILTAIALVIIAIGGMIRGNRWLSEPGMPTNHHGWALYLVAAVVMLVNGWLSIKLSHRQDAERRKAMQHHPPDKEPANPERSASQ
ncbi:MAG: hypothetical protein HUU17_02345 [Chthonomonadales bacterium]|nr:hypothetical protein [Chthonomonadales bacterium]